MRKKLVITNQTARECLSEFIGTFTLMLFGLASMAQFVLGRGDYGTRHTIYWAWGVAVTIAVHVSAGVSGGHVNPAISVAFAVVGKISWRKVPHYMLSQYLGSFVASVCVYILYKDALDAFDGGLRSVDGVNGTAAIWATYPNPDIGIRSCFIDQFLGTFMLLFSVCAIIDSRNCNVPTSLRPLIVGLLIFLLSATMALNCGCALNPARDLSPRIFTAIAGWGPEVFTYRDYFFWIPIIGPHTGAVAGAFTYSAFIEHHWPAADCGIYNDFTVSETHIVNNDELNSRGSDIEKEYELKDLDGTTR